MLYHYLRHFGLIVIGLGLHVNTFASLWSTDDKNLSGLPGKPSKQKPVSFHDRKVNVPAINPVVTKGIKPLSIGAATVKLNGLGHLANDPIRFTMISNKSEVAIGEEIEITIAAELLPITPNMMFSFDEQKGFSLKVIKPDGFIQTGGSYSDDIRQRLSQQNPSITYTLKGKFTKVGTGHCFSLLRGSYSGPSDQLLINKAEICFQLKTVTTTARLANVTGSRSATIVSRNDSGFNSDGENTGTNVIEPGGSGCLLTNSTLTVSPTHNINFNDEITFTLRTEVGTSIVWDGPPCDRVYSTFDNIAARNTTEIKIPARCDDSGEWTVTLTKPGCDISRTLQVNVSVTIPVPSISSSDDACGKKLTANPGGNKTPSSWKWYKDDILFKTTTESNIIVTETGSYKVYAAYTSSQYASRAECGCGEFSSAFVVPSITNRPPKKEREISAQNGTVNQPFSLNLDGTFSDPDGNTIVYFIPHTRLPDGLTLNNKLISGTPTEIGTFGIIVYSNDGSCNSEGVSFSIVISEGTGCALQASVSSSNITLGESVSLITSGASGSVTWIASSSSAGLNTGTSPITAQPSAVGSYVFTASANGCNAAVGVNVSPGSTSCPSSIAINQIAPCLSNGPVQLSISLDRPGGTSSNWYHRTGTNSFTVIPGADQNIWNAIEAGDYKVEVTVPGCDKIISEQVTVAPTCGGGCNLLAQATPTAITLGQTVTLSASGAGTISWSASPATHAGLNTSTNPVSASPTATGTYSFIASAPGCNPATAIVTVGQSTGCPPVNETVSLTDKTIRVGEAFSITLLQNLFVNNSGVMTVNDRPSWLSYDPSTRVLSGTPTSASDIGSSNISVRSGVSDCGDPARRFTITVNPAGSCQIIGNASASSIILGQTVTLTASGASNIGWNSEQANNGLNSAGSPVTATPTAIGTYYYVASASGCNPATVSVNVTQGSDPCATNTRQPENPGTTQLGLNYNYYQRQGQEAFSSVDHLTNPIKTGTASTFSFNGINTVSDYFGVEFSGYINVPTDGQYTFYLNSDDGSRLWIGDQVVVNNDGLHDATSEQSGSICLKAGLHTIKVHYFEAAGDEALLVKWQGPSTAKTEIPASVLVRTGTSTDCASRPQDQSVVVADAAPCVGTTVSLTATGCSLGEASIRWSTGEVNVYSISVSQSVTGTYPYSFTCTYSSDCHRVASKSLTFRSCSSEPPTTSPGAPAIGPQSATVNVAFSLPVSFTGTGISYSAAGLPTGLAINSATGQITGTPSTTGTATVVVTATNQGGSAQVTFTITVNPATVVPPQNQPPVANATPNQTGIVGQNLLFTVSTFTDPDGDAISYTLTGLPNGLAFNGATRQVSGTPSLSGVSSLTLTGNDNRGGVASTTFLLTIQQANSFNGSLTLVAPTYICPTASSPTRGSFTFNSRTSANQPVEYFAIGITGWSTSPGPYVFDVYGDSNPFVLSARIQGQTEQVSFYWSWQDHCKAPNAPVISPANPSVCTGSSVALTASNCVGTIQWSTGQTGNSITYSPTQTGSISATCVGTNGRASDPASTLVTLTEGAAGPILNAYRIGTPLSQSVILSTPGCPTGSSLVWDGPTNATSWTAVLSSTRTFTALCQQTSGCRSQVTVRTVSQITINSPIISITPSSGLPCPGQSISLTAQGCENVVGDNTVVGSARWSTGQIGLSITVNPTVPTTYTAVCIAQGLQSSSSAQIISTQGSLSIAYPAAYTTVSSGVVLANAGNVLSLTAVRTINGNVPAGVQYRWEAPSGVNTSTTGAILQGGTTLSTNLSGLYSVTASVAGQSCSAVASLSITVQGSLSLSITTNPLANPSVCAGNTREIPFTTQGTVPTGTRFVVQLSNASGSFATPTVLGEATTGNTTLGSVLATIPANAPPGNYQVRIVTTNTSPIVIGSSTPLTISAAPALSIVIGYPNNNTVVAEGAPVTLTPQLTPSSPVASYNWFKPDGTTATTPTLTVPFAATAATARYSLTLTTGSGCVLTASSSLTSTEPTCDIRIVAKDAAGNETDRIPRVGGVLGNLTLSVESLDGMALTGYTYSWKRATGINSGTGTNANSVTVVAIDTTPTISATAIGEYSVVITDTAGNTCVAYTTISAKPCTEHTAAYGSCKNVTVQNPDATNAIANLAPGDEFYAGDYKVTVTSITGGGPGGWTGEGIVDVTLLKGINLPAQVTFTNAKLNECYELSDGKLVTKYDPSWSNVVDVDLVGARMLETYVALQQELLELLRTSGSTAEERARITQKIAEIESFKTELAGANLDADLKAAITAESNELTQFASCSLNSGQSNPNGRVAACSYTPWTMLAECLGGAALDVWLSYTFKWLELRVDGNNLAYSDFQGVTSKMGEQEWQKVISSALVSCAFSMVPIPTTRGAALAVVLGATLSSAEAFGRDLISQANTLSNQNLTLKQAFNRLNWNQALAAAFQEGVASAVSIATIRLASHPSVRQFITKAAQKTVAKGRFWVRKMLRSAVMLTDDQIDDLFVKIQVQNTKGLKLFTSGDVVNRIKNAVNSKSGNLGLINEGEVGQLLLDNKVYIEAFGQKVLRPDGSVDYEIDLALEKIYVETKRNLNNEKAIDFVKQITNFYQKVASKDGKKIVIYSSKEKVREGTSGTIRDIRAELDRLIGSDKYIIIDDQETFLTLATQ